MFGNKMNAVEKAIKKNSESSLIELAANHDAAVSIAAVEGLGAVGGLDASNYLVTRLNDANKNMRMAAAKALGKIANVHTKAFLSAQMNKETDPEVKDVMAAAMVLIKEY